MADLIAGPHERQDARRTVDAHASTILDLASMFGQ
jgi:hypothetical protein